MGPDPKAGGAAKIAIDLMNEAAPLAVSGVGGATTGARDRLRLMDKQGLDKYVQQGYRAANTAALEQSVNEAQAARVAAVTGKNPQNVIGQYSGAAAKLAKEQAGIGVSKAAATVSQRNQLNNILLGGAASSTQLGTAFGGLTNRGLAAGLNTGNAAYEGVVGGAAAVSPLLLQLLAQKPGTGYAQSSNLAYQQTGDPRLLAQNLMRVPPMG